MQLHVPERQTISPVDNGHQEPASILLVPGLDNSGPGHWQSHWEALPGFRRVRFDDWSAPRLHDWVPRLDREIRESPKPAVLVGHSLGCLAISWWAALCWSGAFEAKIAGALLVAPPDVDALGAEPRLRDFRPVPRVRLPFPTIVVASHDDPHASFARSEEMAHAWGSELVDLGRSGHINADSRVGHWTQGLQLLAGLSGHKPNRLIAEMSLRAAFA